MEEKKKYCDNKLRGCVFKQIYFYLFICWGLGLKEKQEKLMKLKFC